MARVPAATAGATVASASPADVLNTTPAPAEQGGSRVISRGDSLWALSRLAYGDGARYAVIFNANRDKIHNPNLIYPGQTLCCRKRRSERLLRLSRLRERADALSGDAKHRPERGG